MGVCVWMDRVLNEKIETTVGRVGRRRREFRRSDGALARLVVISAVLPDFAYPLFTRKVRRVPG